MKDRRFPLWASRFSLAALSCRRGDALRLVLLGFCVVLCGTTRDGARADLLLGWSDLESLLQEESPRPDDYEPAQDIELVTAEDSPLVFDAALLHPEAGLLEIDAPPLHGSVSRGSHGGFVYAPAPDFSGSDAFTWRGQDEGGLTLQGRVSLFVEPRNDPPRAAPAHFAATTGEALRVHAPGVLGSCQDADGDALWISLATPPEHGEVQLEDDGAFTYVPAAGFTGTDTFTFEASDGMETATSLVHVHVHLPAPVTFVCDATDDATVSTSGANVSYGTDPQLRLQAGAASSRCYLRFQVRGTGERVQRATLRLFCLESSRAGGHVYRVADDFRGTRSPWNERLLSWNNAPLLGARAHARLGAVAAATWVEIDVTSLIEGDGTVSFALAGGTNDGARYSSKEGSHPPQLEVVAIVSRENDNLPPLGMDDTYEVGEDVPLEAYAPGLLENDVDEDGDYLYVVSRSEPSHGILVVGEEGGFVYRPHPDYYGPDSFTYVMSDLRGGMDTRTVAITVVPEEDAPVADGDSWLLLGVETLHVLAPGVLHNDSDADAERLSAELLSGASHGSVVLAADGAFEYTPHSGYTGTDSFVYRATDGSGASLPAVVTLHVDGPTSAGKTRQPQEAAAANTLDRVFPNPFGRGTWIEFRLAQPGLVEAEVYDVRGQRLRLLTSADQTPGSRSLYWDGRDARGLPLPTGIYFLRMRLGDELRTRKLVLQR